MASSPSTEVALARGAKLVVSVDCGIRAEAFASGPPQPALISSSPITIWPVM